MGVGYTTIMYGAESIHDGFGDIAACQYDGVEIGIEKIRANDPDQVGDWISEYELELYCVMSEWLETEAAVERMIDDMSAIAKLDADFVGLLPPQRGRQGADTLQRWLTRLSDAAVKLDVQPLIHHHGATAVEQVTEIQHYLDEIKDLELLWDTAHHYPYGENFPSGDITDGIERFADDISYVHLKDVDPIKEFAANRDALSSGDFHLDNVINYFRSFTDLGDGIIDFEGAFSALKSIGYDGHYTVEIENQTEQALVHAKQNHDYWNNIKTD